jgi:uncharacterized protein YbjT (DUF2867 family)
MSTNPKYLITGVTGGLGASVLRTLSQHVDHTRIVVSSSRASLPLGLNSTYPEIEFRQMDFNNRAGMEQALVGIDRLFFVSTDSVNPTRRAMQHENVVFAARTAGVKHIYYSSLAFGGHESNSKCVVQTAHLVTENLLKMYARFL